MRVLGISPLDKDATVSVVEDGAVLYAAAEERFSRTKQHAGFPHGAIADALRFTGLKAADFDEVAYAFLDPDAEIRLRNKHYAEHRELGASYKNPNLKSALKAAEARKPNRPAEIPGLGNPEERMEKGALKTFAYALLGPGALSRMADQRGAKHGNDLTRSAHNEWKLELENGLTELGLRGKLKRYEHHLSHAANSYFASGWERALIITLDGYGSGLAAAVSLGEGGKVKRLQGIGYPNTLGGFYESVTSSLGFKPSRHEGKIVGLASYGDPTRLSAILLDRFRVDDGSYWMEQPDNIFFSRYLASRFPKIDVAAAYQNVLEIVVQQVVRYWVEKTGCGNIVLSGGVAANVKMNQRVFEVEGVEQIFVYPNMGDGGCGTGLALMASWPGGVQEPYQDVYFGPEFTDAQIREAIEAENLQYSAPGNLAAEVASRIHSGEVVARFGGRMEYGPRALGNRSILYHAREPDVNQWLNKRLGRTEFMPFAPVTLWEARHDCFLNLNGAEKTAQFMTITFDCTDSMKRDAPAAVHVDGTARPQLIREEVNPEYYGIVKEYKKLSGIPTLINTSFNMHEEPIVCTPQDAVRAFLQGHLDGLAIGPYYVPNPRAPERRPQKVADAVQT